MHTTSTTNKHNDNKEIIMMMIIIRLHTRSASRCSRRSRSPSVSLLTGIPVQRETTSSVPVLNCIILYYARLYYGILCILSHNEPTQHIIHYHTIDYNIIYKAIIYYNMIYYAVLYYDILC